MAKQIYRYCHDITTKSLDAERLQIPNLVLRFSLDTLIALQRYILTN